MIISASRRTDIPAFYSEWFMNRIRSGFLLTRNPFNANQIRRIALSPDVVDVIVFWTRNPLNLLPHLEELDERGYKYYFQYTITGYPRVLERSVPNPHKAIETFKILSDRIGSGRVVWRFDPVLISSAVNIDEHVRLYTKIASSLRGYTDRVVISFADLYKNVARNIVRLEREHHITFDDISSKLELMKYFASMSASIAGANDMIIQSCAEKADLLPQGVMHGKCIDDEMIFDLFGIRMGPSKDKGQREECGCIKSVDIGQYNSCLHGCSYCYATYSETAVAANYSKHDPKSSFLIGSDSDVNREILTPEHSQKSLFET